ncbi:MAG: helix-hairpin-helix domain-containing protein [Flavobacteriaceae bacterium]|jgi:DNA uptake protein ComE-like DNA-binding protein|nr:helix-hairpin-helix domain-containing protein [Flavobacteriaceae bacterium]MDG2275103.1 helix-hairpin-helix domain-containing protein [Flavobacteriaceae bacterium]|tara:strand:- start:19 stop:693 length:675 start_codon:yes stop_codon:yes gene_type:complete
MKKFSTLFIITLSVSLFLISCKESAEKKQNTPNNLEVKEVEKPSPLVVLNANLATESDLVALGFSQEVVQQLLAARPFLSMADFNSIIESENTEELFKKIFVPFNLNTTDEKDFKMIPGVGDKMAHEFEEYRPYTSILQFKREIGKYVDEEEVARYLDYVFVPVELNTSSEDHIKALPGIGKKMTHEFLEYRPYKNLAQFRKEIGKYVDDKELSRLERFVYLKD